MRKKLSLMLVTLMLAGSLAACGDEASTETTTEPVTESGIATEEEPVVIEEAPEDVTDEIVEGEVEPDTSDVSDTSDTSDTSEEFAIGTTTESMYTDQNAGIQIEVPEGWVFITDAATMSSVTGEAEEDIEALWDGSLSPMSQEMSYVAIAYNEETGSNIIVSYHNIGMSYDEPMGEEEYVSYASAGMEGTTSTAELAGDTWGTFELAMDESAGYSQMIMVKQADTNDMVMVLLTFTDMDNESMDEMVSFISPLG